MLGDERTKRWTSVIVSISLYGLIINNALYNFFEIVYSRKKILRCGKSMMTLKIISVKLMVGGSVQHVKNYMFLTCSFTLSIL